MFLSAVVRSLTGFKASGESVMTQSNGETRLQRGRAQQLRDGITARSRQARAAVRNVTADDVKGFFRRNAFVILTVAAVIIGEMMCGIKMKVDDFAKMQCIMIYLTK